MMNSSHDDLVAIVREQHTVRESANQRLAEFATHTSKRFRSLDNSFEGRVQCLGERQPEPW
jgi:hypothetical protein